MGLNEVKITDSIGFTLFKRIFGVYCLTAIAITAVQMWGEYQTAKSAVQKNIRDYQPFLEQSLANAVWHLDLPQMERILVGVLNNHEIVGISIRGEQKEVLTRRGKVSTEEQALPILKFEDPNLDMEALVDPVFEKGLFSHSFPLFDPNGLTDIPIGSVIFYTDSSVVITKVQGTFISILLGAFFKTLILWLLFILFGRYLLSRPLEKLVATVRGLPLDSHIDMEISKTKGVNELQLLDTAIDTMKQKLNQTLQQLRMANEELSESNIVLQRATEQSPSIISIFNREGNLEYTNPSFTRIYGYLPEEAQQAYDERLYSKSPIRERIKQLLDPATADTEWRGEVQNLTKTGALSWISASLSPVRDAEGSVTHFVGIGVNINELKLTEEALKQKTLEQQETIIKLENTQYQLIQSEKMASIGQLAAGVAHEINNPIGYINSNLGTLNQYMNDLMRLTDLYNKLAENQVNSFEEAHTCKKEIDYEFLTEDIQNLIDESREGIGRVKGIIKDLKDFSHADKGEWVISDLHQGLNSTLNIVWNELKYKAEVVKEFAEIPEIRCIPSQLNQVFMNLLINAAHAIKERGTITIKTGSDEQSVWVEVSDTGSGISQEHLSRLFEPFFTTKPLGKGTGLGLSVSYGIVKKHGGRIEVNSELGQGSTFRIILPIQQQEAA